MTIRIATPTGDELERLTILAFRAAGLSVFVLFDATLFLTAQRIVRRIIAADFDASDVLAAEMCSLQRSMVSRLTRALWILHEHKPARKHASKPTEKRER